MTDETPPLGATGKFPQGKISEDDEGELVIGVGHTDKLVYLQFGKSLSWLAMPPVEAVDFALTIIRHAEGARAHANTQPGPGSSESDDVRGETPPES